MAWEVPWLLDRMDEANDFYFDSATQVWMDSWSRGRVVLLGDAAWCSAPSSGQGTSLAVVGAYILAGELAIASQHETAFAEFERRMRPWVELTQKTGRDNAKRFSANNRFQFWLQIQTMRLMPYLPGKSLFMRKMLSVVDGIELPDYADTLRVACTQDKNSSTA
jgi:2-polyprenyl-6-methoxyphenol hydroxylase-like FAD-dependent oxidoreductase